MLKYILFFTCDTCISYRPHICSNQSYGVRKQNLIIHQNIVTWNDLLHIYQVADSHESTDVARRRGCHSCWLFMYILYSADRCHFGNKFSKLNRVSEILRTHTIDDIRIFPVEMSDTTESASPQIYWVDSRQIWKNITKKIKTFMSKCYIQTGLIAD